ncbi:hypothetical protein TI01_1432 [Lysobacter sp. A03]|nr:hypothetical protein TI01_1432 [Lysobacter sp. A03]
MVDVAVQELDQHLAADAGQGVAAPIGAGHPLGHAHPGAAGVVAGRVALRVGAGSGLGEPAGVGRRAPLPGKLDPHLMVAGGGNGRFGQADHGGSLHSGRGGLEAVDRYHRGLGGDGEKPVAVVAAFDPAGRIQQFNDAAVQIVGGAVFDDQRHERLPGQVGVLAQGEGKARRHAAGAAGAGMQALRQAHRVQLQDRVLVGVAASGKAPAAWGAEAFKRGSVRSGWSAGGDGRHRLDLLGLPAGGTQDTGGDLALLAEALDRVGRFGRVAAVEAQRGLDRLRHARIAIEDHQGDAAFGFLRMLEPPRQPSIGQQTEHELVVTLAVLGGDGIDRQGLGGVDAQCRLRVVVQNAFQHAERIQVLEHQRVAAQLQECSPRLHHQPVACQAAVAAQCDDAGAVAVPVAQTARRSRASCARGTRASLRIVGPTQAQRHRVAD